MAARVRRDEPAEHVVVLTLENPDKLGAIDTQMRYELREHWRAIGADPDVRAVVLTGTGRGFSTGLDVSAAATSDDPATEFASVSELPAFGLSPWDFDVWVPYIVAVNGVCAGGGFHLLTEADIVIASDDATFVDPHVSVGQVAGIEPANLARRISLEAVLRMIVLGKHGKLSASDALRLGLISEVLSKDDLVDRAVALASLAATGSPAAIAASKQSLWKGLDVGLDGARSVAWQAIRSHWSHPDYREGIEAFAARREPQWSEAT